MTDAVTARERLAAALSPQLLDALEELVEQRVDAALDRRGGDPEREPAPFLTVAQYAGLHHTTPAAVRARIRRGALQAIRPPGGREYLIPVNDGG